MPPCRAINAFGNRRRKARSRPKRCGVWRTCKIEKEYGINGDGELKELPAPHRLAGAGRRCAANPER